MEYEDEPEEEYDVHEIPLHVTSLEFYNFLNRLISGKDIGNRETCNSGEKIHKFYVKGFEVGSCSYASESGYEIGQKSDKKINGDDIIETVVLKFRQDIPEDKNFAGKVETIIKRFKEYKEDLEGIEKQKNTALEKKAGNRTNSGGEGSYTTCGVTCQLANMSGITFGKKVFRNPEIGFGGYL